MYAKQTILAKLDELLQYSITQIPTLSHEGKETFDADYTNVVSGGKSSVSDYFSADRSQFKKPLDDLGLYLHNELWQRGAKWETEFDMGMSDDFPEAYNDLRKLFYDFTWFMELTNEDFFNAWSYELPENPDPTVTPTPAPSNNTYVSRLCSELVLEQVLQQELENVDTLATWLEKSMSQSGSVGLWENQGALLQAPETRTLAYQIYLDMGLKEAIEMLNLPVYVPTYFGGDVHKFSRTYPSVQAMYADENFEVGKYVLISSNDADNGNLYIRTEKEFSFIANICGPKGDKGDAFKFSDFTPEQLESLRGPQGGGDAPIGSIVLFANASSIPLDYLVCDGSGVSRTTYSNLFSVIGTTFGAGDGSTTFNLPKLDALNGAIETWGDLKEHKSNVMAYIIKVK